MNIFPDDNVELDDIISDTVEDSDSLDLLKEYAWDFENNKFIIQDGKFKMVEGLEAVKVWIYKALLTDRYRYMAYSWDYGHEFEDLIGETLSDEVKESEYERLVYECLSPNQYVTGIEDVSITTNGANVSIDVTVNTVYGEVSVSV